MLNILVDGESSINILYDHAVDRIVDAPELARRLINSQTQSLLYEFDRSEAHSPGTLEFPVHADPFNVVIEFCVLDAQSLYNAILGRPWIYMMRAILFTHHQLPKYPIKSGMANIRGGQVMSRTIAIVARKRSTRAQKTSREGHDEDFPMDKKKKTIANQ